MTQTPGAASRAADEPNPLAFSIDHSIARRWPFRTVPIRLDRPILSLSFDDFPLSAYENGGQILEQHGARGTFYTCTGQLGTRVDMWDVAPPDAVVDLQVRGHEIGLHTHSHRQVNTMAPPVFAADLAANRAALRRLLPGTTNETFAYPYGISGIRQKRMLGSLARASRSVQPALNTGRLDLDFIKAFELIDCRFDRSGIAALLDEACRAKAWIVFLTHDVAERPTQFGCSPALLEATLAEAARRDMAILPIAGALDVLGVP
jgi:peptidoglycan/xylan/chitin deacetylase (PgdA/CDA1 family)